MVAPTDPDRDMARRDVVRLGRGRPRRRPRQRRLGAGGKDRRAEERELTDAAHARESASCHFILGSARHWSRRGGIVGAARCQGLAAAPGEQAAQRHEGLARWYLAQLQRRRPRHHLPQLDRLAGRPGNGVDLRSHGPYVLLHGRRREVEHRGAIKRPALRHMPIPSPGRAQHHGAQHQQRHGPRAADRAGA